MFLKLENCEGEQKEGLFLQQPVAPNCSTTCGIMCNAPAGDRSGDRTNEFNSQQKACEAP